MSRHPPHLSGNDPLVPLHKAASDLQSEIDTLLSQHRSELRRWVATWVRRQEKSASSADLRVRTSDDIVQELSPACPPDDPPPALLPGAASTGGGEGDNEGGEGHNGHGKGGDKRVSNAWMLSGSEECSEPGPIKMARISASKSTNGSFIGLGNGGEVPVVPTSPSHSMPSPSHAQSKMVKQKTCTMKNSTEVEKEKAGFKKFRKTRSQMRANNFLNQSKREEAMMKQSVLQKITSHRSFEWFTGVLIVSNAAFIGYQAQYYAVKALDNGAAGKDQALQEPTSFLVLQSMFCLAFMLELGLRWAADGICGFFQTTELQWNVFDVIVVGFGVVDIMSSVWPLLHSKGLMSNTSILRVMRVVRIVRVARVIRIMRFFRELRMMIFALLGSLKSLLWALIILSTCFFMFGISLTTGTTELLADGGYRVGKHQDLVDHFGTLDRSVMSLFMAMSGGKDWGDLYEMLTVLTVMHKGLFLMFICFSVFAVVNIVTGIFVDSALQCNQSDRDIVVQEEIVAKERYLESMRDVFEEMDEDNKGTITLEEFEKKTDDERVIAYFNALKLDVTDARQLFMLLDYDQSGEIDIGEFLSGCHKLKGESRALDMAIMQYEIRFVTEAMINLQEMVMKKLHS